MIRQSYYIINAITLYRLLAAPVLIVLIFYGNIDVFKWLLALSYFTDLIDGFLARKFKVDSILGARLDSIADDFTIIASLIALFVLKYDFVTEHAYLLAFLFILFVLQNIFALKKYHRISSFHTYMAKLAAILQGCFFILIFLLPMPSYTLFYSAALVTGLELIEEIILVNLLQEWETNVKGIYWVLKRKRE